MNRKSKANIQSALFFGLLGGFTLLTRPFAGSLFLCRMGNEPY